MTLVILVLKRQIVASMTPCVCLSENIKSNLAKVSVCVVKSSTLMQLDGFKSHIFKTTSPNPRHHNKFFFQLRIVYTKMQSISLDFYFLVK